MGQEPRVRDHDGDSYGRRKRSYTKLSDKAPNMSSVCEKQEYDEQEIAAQVKTESFFHGLYQLKGDEEASIDKVIDFFETNLVAGDYRTCAFALTRANVQKMNLAASLAVLSMTLAAKDELNKQRVPFYSQVRDLILADPLRRGEANRLLSGLA